jgi:hypothetical protein
MFSVALLPKVEGPDAQSLVCATRKDTVEQVLT